MNGVGDLWARPVKPFGRGRPPFSKDFEDAVGLERESVSVRRVARQFGLAASTARAIDLRYLKRWNAMRRKDPLGVPGKEIQGLLQRGRAQLRVSLHGRIFRGRRTG